MLENVVITGGGGAIGLHYAQYCIEHGARRIVLLSRNGVETEALSRLAGQHDVQVFAPQCDITDRAAVSAVAAEYAGTGASMLIHTAGIAAASVHADLTGADVAAVCAAKVTGLAVMADVWPLQPDCRILACSSVFGVWGGHGHAAYAASNRILDALAAQLRSRGLDCTAIRWGLWQDAGVVTADEIARTQRSGLVAMRPESGGGRQSGSIWRRSADLRCGLRSASGVLREPGNLACRSSLPSDTGECSSSATTPAVEPLADVVRAELAATLHMGDLGVDRPDRIADRPRFGFAVGARSAPTPAPGRGALGSGGADARRNHRQRIDRRLGLRLDQRPRHEEGWNPRVTDTTGLGTLDAQRLELLRRKIAERGLARPPVADDADAATDTTQLSGDVRWPAPDVVRPVSRPRQRAAQHLRLLSRHRQRRCRAAAAGGGSRRGAPPDACARHTRPTATAIRTR